MEFWIQALLLSSSFVSVTLAGSVFDRQECAVPCGAGCGLFGDTCCTTPSGAPNLCGYGTSCCFEGCCNFGSTCQPDGTCLASPGDPGILPPRPVDPGTGEPAPVITTITNPDGSTVTSTIGVPGGAPGSPGPVVTTITSVDGTITNIITSTIAPPPGAPITVTPPEPTTSTLPDGTVVTISAGQVFWGPNTFPVPTGLTSPQTITTFGETFTFTPTAAPNPGPTGADSSLTTLPGGLVATFTAGQLVWGTNTIPVPTGLTAPQTITTLDQTIVFTPSEQPNPGPTVTDVLITTLPDQMVVTSSAGQLLWGTFVVPVPTGLSTTAIVTTNGETFTFLPSVGGGDNPPSPTSTATTDGALVTFTTWPDIVSIFPVSTDVPNPKNDDGKPTIPCKAWFFFVCISFNLPDLNIFGWSFGNLPAGIYPIGPPPGLIFPPGFNLPGPLPPWPRLTIGLDGVPTYAEEPTSCETSSATIFVTTTSFGVVDAQTTATQVLSTSSIVLGCDVEDSASTTTTTSTCGPTATACGIYVPLSDGASDPPVTKFLDDSNALATSVFDFVNSFWSDQDAATLTSMSTVTVIPVEPTSVSPPAPTSTWILAVYDVTCKEGETAQDFNYYSLDGIGEQTPNEPCISLRRDAPQDTSYSCRFFEQGGRNPSKPCSAGTFSDPASFVIRNGFCTLFTNDDCTGFSNGITSNVETGCTDVSSNKFLPTTWGSISCFALPLPKSK